MQTKMHAYICTHVHLLSSSFASALRYIHYEVDPDSSMDIFTMNQAPGMGGMGMGIPSKANPVPK